MDRVTHIELPDKWSATISLTVSEPQPQYGTVQLNARRAASDELISCDVDKAAFLAALSDVTGVVVIDPEDREQVERLVRAYLDCGDGIAELSTEPWSLPGMRMRAALREFANPPKPDEPTGLGAVVKDKGGRKWVRAGHSYVDPNWRVAGGDEWTRYADISVSAVLSDGVQP